ncbi:cytochrome ubiquinol oxidase subunit I [Alcaligenes nematophilus]|jgi:cytochrome d ubiquinol oxidase subunit I|uniref:Cytochrome ubiquinol oxidase subunit I n=3 Tax=Alcaligenes TaxID=507 RepID=A0AAE9H7Q0_ALCFA|nr:MULTISPECIES: cytochrome ubiquinol oxidase subunit I [Alcaligenes]MDH4865814.1 cytochrome ubiquinol oxidase subunit I [Bacillus cereus]EKU30016.1 cytochrome D ubiquinol oxidase subunit I [Alcaligenes sp. HPC1271]ERI32507.1 cytochrome BD oxidase subunit I [Alcaligenes sp. EGD-AK7]KGP02212.1 cytochrome d terminal oxidase subunit 1 [Alcaligenes faecalis]KVX05029.1 cytochrome d terminal oxidase subunit 1 [Alcaligenes faecalis]
MIDLDVVTLSRLQFASTAMFHFLFVPLTLGLSFLLAIMESVYVMTGKAIWRRMTKFWGVLFGINFALGVATGIVMEFQFGMNWAYYSHYVGDIFGAPLAIEGLMAFFLEATFVGLFFFGWDRLSKLGHLIVTWLVAIGTNLSALWILVANGWMQNPVGAIFNPHTMRMEMTDFAEVILNPVAQAKVVHTVSAGYVLGAMFVMGISAWYLLRGRHIDLAKRSMTVAASFGLAASLSVVVLGDESGYLTTEHQQMKIAAMESMWETEEAPASFNLLAWPDQEARENRFAVEIPWVMGLIGTRSVSTPMLGINELVEHAKIRIANGLRAYEALQLVRADDSNIEARRVFDNNWKDLGYALLLKRYTDDITKADTETIAQAAWDTVPQVAPLFWSFRVMVALGLYFILFFGVAFVLASRDRLQRHPRLLKAAVWSIPLPWIAIECGWFVAEFGRQPWAIEGVLPTYYAASGLSFVDLMISMTIFLLLYTTLAVIGIKVMLHSVRKGPDEAGETATPSALSYGSRNAPLLRG